MKCVPFDLFVENVFTLFVMGSFLLRKSDAVVYRCV